VLFAFVVMGLVFFCTTPRDWLGRTSPKWAVLCQVGCKIWTQSVSQFNYHVWLLWSFVMKLWNVVIVMVFCEKNTEMEATAPMLCHTLQVSTVT